MGNAAGTLGISLSEEVVTAGDPISGTVYCQIAEEIDAECLVITIFGTEYSKVVWHETHGSGDNRKRVRRHRTHTRPLLHIDVPLATFPTRKLVPGRYEFPFSLVLPTGLPSSMYCRSEGNCKILYGIKAKLTRPGTFSWSIKTSRPLVVSAMRLPPQPVPVFVEPDTQKVKFCCCINRGSMTLGTTLDDAAIGRGETMGVGVACKNDSTSPIQGIRITVVEQVVWHAGGRHNSRSRTIASCVLDPSLCAGAEALDEEAQRQLKAQGVSTHAGNYQALYQQLSSGSLRASVPLAHDARDTYMGPLIQCRTTMTVSLRTATCITNPSVSVPLKIGPPALQAMAPIVQGVPIAQAVPWLEGGMDLTKEESQALTAKPEDWGGAVVAQAVAIPMGNAVIGGTEQDKGEGEEDEEDAAQPPPSAAWPAASQQGPPTLQLLLQEMDQNIDDLSMFRYKLTAPEQRERWLPLLSSLPPAEFGDVVGRVSLEFDQPKVAALLAGDLAPPPTSEHIIAAVRKGAWCYRAAIVTAMAPLCTSLDDAGATAIRQELSEWDRVVVASSLPPVVAQGP